MPGLLLIHYVTQRKKINMKSLGNILLRIIATFAASGLSVIGAGAIAGVDTITAVTVAVPFAVPQEAFVVTTVAEVGPLVVLILNIVLNVQLLLSLTKMVCEPADKPVVKLVVPTPSKL